MLGCNRAHRMQGVPLHLNFQDAGSPCILMLISCILIFLTPSQAGSAQSAGWAGRARSDRNFKTPLKRCASTRAFEWSRSRVIWRLASKVMANLLSPYSVVILRISRIASVLICVLFWKTQINHVLPALASFWFKMRLKRKTRLNAKRTFWPT